MNRNPETPKKLAPTNDNSKLVRVHRNPEGGALWHEVTEKEKQQIKQDSKKLLKEFASKLSKIKAPEGHHENKTGTREEGSGWKTDEEFRSTTFANAPFVEDNFLVAEKGAWKK